jgi:hypothetical protein
LGVGGMSTPIEPDEFPLPEVGDYLFEPEVSIHQAPVERHELYRFHAMKDGYKLAGDVLVQHWLTQKRSSSGDSLVFPIIFCYRHFLELSMKWILWHREEYRSMSIFDEHDLNEIWSKCRLLFQEFEFNTDPQVEASQRMILEMHEKDERSFNFRYTLDRQGKLIELEMKGVDLVRLREGIEKLHNFFDIAETIMNVELDARSDFI